MLPRYRVDEANKKIVCKKRITKKTKTPEQYKRELKEKHIDVIPLEDYVTAKTKIKHKFSCGHINKVAPDSILRGSKCLQCKNISLGKNKRKSHEQFISELAIINNNIKVLGTYHTANTRIEVECLVCQHIWSPIASSLLMGFGCPRCANKLITEDEFLQRFNICGDKNIIICGRYVNSHTKIDCCCTICGYKMKMYSYQLTNGVGCKKCKDKISGQKRKITNEQFINRVKLVNPDLIVLDAYSGANNKVRVKCSKCECIWEPTAHVIMKNNPTNCPYCQVSKLEKGVKDYLNTIDIKYQQYYKYKKLNGVGEKPLSYDFYLPTYNLLIECQGIQHEKPIDFFGGNKQFITQKIHDIRKRRYAHDNNIRFLEIWYYEKNKINKILEQTLNNLKSVSLTTAG